MIHAVNGNEPQIEQEVFIAEDSKIIGDVYIKSGASIWFNSIVRGDLGPIKIGKKTNIQENSTLHIDADSPLIIGDDVTVGHNSVLHGCTINNNCIIGMGAVILNNANIGKNTIIGAGALVPENKKRSANQIISINNTNEHSWNLDYSNLQDFKIEVYYYQPARIWFWYTFAVGFAVLYMLILYIKNKNNLTGFCSKDCYNLYLLFKTSHCIRGRRFKK